MHFLAIFFFKLFFPIWLAKIDFFFFREINCNRFTLWKLQKFTVTKKNFVKLTTYLVISLVKMLLSRNFCQKRVTVNFRNFHTVFGKPGNCRVILFFEWFIFRKNSVKSIYSVIRESFEPNNLLCDSLFSIKLISRKFLQTLAQHF